MEIRLPPWLLLLPLLLLAIGGATLAASSSPSLEGRVSWIRDGDTLDVSGVGRVRLLGIDTPEKTASQRDNFFVKRWGLPPDALRLIARQALEFNISTAKGKQVVLIPGDPPRDKYDRLLARVVLPDGTELNRLLVERGLAVVYRRFDFPQKATLLQAEERARRKRVGLWAHLPAPHPETP